jgi:hypothetical protein
MRSLHVIALAGMMLGCTCVPAAVAAECSTAMGNKASELVYTIGSWRDLSAFYKAFEGCDNGDIAVGLSDRVADLLSNQWDKFGEFASLASTNGAFRAFVLYHVDSQMRPEQAAKILDNARNHCPDDGANYCGAVAHEVLEAFPNLKIGGS